MGLLQKAVETYDAMEHLAGVITEGVEPLAPVGHICTNAAIEITIDQEGNYVQASKVDQKIIIPATEKSAGRTSAPAPHPLCDQIGYICGTDDTKRELYLDQLAQWANEANNAKLNAIFQYVKKGTALTDLQRASLIAFNEDGTIKNEKDLICWRVIGVDDGDSAVWTDRNLQKSFWDHYLKRIANGNNVISMVSGKCSAPAEQHLKGVFPLAGNAKLISTNDTTYFTYLGRFLDADEALTVSYTDSQKGHNALKWILATQRVVIGNRAFVCWNPKGDPLPRPLLPLIANDETVRVPSDYLQELRSVINGYKSGLSVNADAVIASFEAATPGRIAVTYYNECSAADFLDRLEMWDSMCCWYDTRWGTSSPTIMNIVRYAFGTQRGNDEAARVEADDKMVSQQVQRLMICRLENTVFPVDVVKALVQRASAPECYNRKNRGRLLFTTCAAIRKYRNDKFKEVWDMALEPEKKDRSYQFGRLLAILEKVERDTYDRDEKRETNAIRMQTVFVRRPGYASRIIMDQLKNAYYPRLTPGQRMFYEKLIGEIMAIISETGEESFNKPLGDTYLLGYYLQKNALYTKKASENKEDDNE